MVTVFGDVDGIMVRVPDYFEEEPRFLLVGRSGLRRSLVIVSVGRGESRGDEYCASDFTEGWSSRGEDEIA
jgi:hypothetical protein